MADDQSGIVAAGGWCAPSETIYAFANERDRFHQLLYGQAEPTQEEIDAEIDRRMRVYLDELKAWTETQAFLREVAAWEPLGLPKAILALHSHHEQKWGVAGHVDIRCSECEVDEHSVQWPCATARIVLAQKLIAVPDELEYEEPTKPVRDESNPRWPFPAGPVDDEFAFPEVSVARGGLRFATGPHAGTGIQ